MIGYVPTPLVRVAVVDQLAVMVSENLIPMMEPVSGGFGEEYVLDLLSVVTMSAALPIVKVAVL